MFPFDFCCLILLFILHSPQDITVSSVLLRLHVRNAKCDIIERAFTAEAKIAAQVEERPS